MSYFINGIEVKEPTKPISNKGKQSLVEEAFKRLDMQKFIEEQNKNKEGK